MSALTSFGKTVSRNRNIVLAYVAMLVLLTAVSIYRPGFGWGDPLHLRALDPGRRDWAGLHGANSGYHQRRR